MTQILLKRSFFLVLLTGILFGCTPAAVENQNTANSSLTDGISAIRAEAGPLLITPPEGYKAENNQEGISISRVSETGSMLIGIRIVPSSGQTADRLIEDYMNDLPVGWNRLIENEELDNLIGRGSRYSLEDHSGRFLIGRVIALTTTTRDYLIFAIMDREDWISQGSTDFSDMLDTIKIEDTAAAQVNLPATDTEEQDSTDEKTIEVESTKPSPTATPSAVGIPPFAGKSAAGYACFGGFDTGLNCILPSGDWAHYTENNSNLADDSIFDMTACPDGRILIINVNRLVLFDGSDFIQIEQPDRFSLPDLAGCGPQGEVWLTHYRGVSVYRENKWEFFEKSEIVKDEETVFDGLEIAPDGTVWIMSFNEIASLAPGDSDWESYAEGDGLDDQYYFDGLSLDSDGTPYLSRSNGYMWFSDGQWLSQEVDSFFLDQLEITADQQVYLGTFSEGLIVSGRDSVHYQTTEDGLSRNNIDLIDSDTQGRIWITTETGVDIFDGKNWTQVRMDNSELAYNRFNSFVVIEEGPILPSIETEPGGSLTGQLNNSVGTPLANSPVTLCLNGYVSYTDPEENPCLSSVESFNTQTDTAGSFLIENIPSAWYKLFFTVGGTWQELNDENGFLAELILIESQETTDLGSKQAE
jgi:hypothetical protein